MCRKRGNSSSVCLTQDYYGCNRTVRRNSQIFAFTGMSSDRDVKFIMNEFSLGVDKKELLEMFKFATSDGLHVFVIDNRTKNPLLRFRRDFRPLPWSGIDPGNNSRFMDEKKTFVNRKESGAIKRKRKELNERMDVETGGASAPSGQLAPIAHTINQSVHKIPSRWSSAVLIKPGRMINRTEVRKRARH